MLSSLVVRARADRNLAIGIVVGSLAALWLVVRAYQDAGSPSLFLQFTLIGVSASDPATYLTAGVLQMLVALAACLLPAIRAMQSDPMVALRQE